MSVLRLCVCLSVTKVTFLNYGQTKRPRDTIIGMHTYVTPKSNIGYTILTSDVCEGHLRSKRVTIGNFGPNLESPSETQYF